MGLRTRRRGRARGAAIAGLATVVAAILAPQASAVVAPGGPPTPTATIHWSTYLRAGPGETYAAISELEHDATVGVIGCGVRWCSVLDGSDRGYVDRDALDLPRTLAPDPPARTDCVVVGQADNRKPIATRFCGRAANPSR